ncbi:hypothetical protein WI84_07735 [Burkholderia ubonensis]|uniref:cupin domain-containing protein n=1 Tax=Burkholderia ubonensis TaxID=101571 RepID=UPI00075F06B5|nr:cupin domain-containing protein [Burkholderia ubonensis]KVD40505.1 hypothetical protein WI84_07735 [Burkholderia ubonensis]
MKSSPVVHLDELELVMQQHGERHASRQSAIGPKIGFKWLGCKLVEVLPGKRAWPFHHHYGNEELFVILEGEGMLRHGDSTYCVSAGDLIGAQAGGAEHAHQLINTSTQPLRYLAISTQRAPDVVGYPGSRKFAVFAGAAPGGPKEARTFEHIARLDAAVDYWDGE